ncbi:MAG TPA: hypothetical protein VIK72_14770 [Clostridiaceae bacterium]
MKIANSLISMSSSHSSEVIYSKRQNIQAWDNRGSPTSQISKNIKNILDNALVDKLQISHAAFKKFREQVTELTSSNVSQTQDLSTSIVSGLSEKDKLIITLIEETLSAIIGRKITFVRPKDVNTNNIQVNLPFHLKGTPIKSTSENSSPKSEGWGINFNSQEIYKETESMNFKAAGMITTDDGKQINFSVELAMSRSFATENNISFKAGDALLDPLVINYAGKAALLTDTKFSFDIDSDGKEDQISSLKEGSGFLSLDLNNNGKIDNGSELFGPKTGNGFQNLENYDTDKNGWIDENDSIFNKLRIWTKDSDGTDRLFALGEKGIGAIYLGNTATEFTMKNSSNDTLGKVSQSGIFVREDGTVGTMGDIKV